MGHAKALTRCQRPGCTHPVKHKGNKYCSQDCARLVWSQPKVKPPTPPPTPKAEPLHTSTFDVKGDRAELTKTTYERVRTLDDLKRLCEIDTDTWDVERFTCQTQEMGSMPRATGNKADGWQRESTVPIITQLFHVKAWLTRRTLIITVRQEIAALVAEAETRLALRPKPSPRPKPVGECLLEVAIYDAHFGKLAWGRETGYGNYDLKIAEREFDRALETIIARTSSFQFDEIVFVLGNDVLNSDTRANTTTAGTPQDTDGRYYKAFGVVRQVATRAIERLRQMAPVRVPMVGGNHDNQSVWHLGDSLQCLYHRDDDVIIDNAPRPRKYHQYGDVMLMWTHGDKGKRKDYPHIMASEEPAMWGATKYREIHLGHRHMDAVESFPGVQMRTIRALTETDFWHSDNGYVGNLRGAESFVFHRSEGLISQVHYTVKAEEAAA